MFNLFIKVSFVFIVFGSAYQACDSIKLLNKTVSCIERDTCKGK